MGYIFNPTAAGAAGLTGSSIKTIGTGGDYSDVAAFIAGESTPYHGVFVSDVTEDSDVALDGTVVLDLDRYTLTMGTNQFTSAAAVNLSIRGAGPATGAEIDYTATGVNEELIDLTGVTSVVDCQGFLFDNNSSASNTDFCSTGSLRITNMKAELPDLAGCGFIAAGGGGSYADNVEVVGGGSSCDTGISGFERFSNIYVSGQWSATIQAVLIGANNTASNLFFNHDTNAALLFINTDSSISNIQTESSQVLNLTVGDINAHITNIFTNGGTIDLQDKDNARLTNFECATLDLTDAGATNCLFTNGRITSAITVAGDRHKLVNCEVVGGGSVSSGGDDNSFVGCQFGADAGGGALTLTIDAGSNRTIVDGCRSDAAVVDNGTNSAIDYVLF